MSQPACAHPFHDDPPTDESYELDDFVGYRCPDCGFVTIQIVKLPTRQEAAADFRAALHHLDAAVRAGEMTRAMRRSFIRMGQTWFRHPARVRRMHAAYGRRSR